MRIHHQQDTQTFIRDLTASIARDPVSLKSWRCLHIKHDEDMPVEWYRKMLEEMRELHKDVECDIVHCADNDILLISRQLNAMGLYELAEDLINGNPEELRQHTSTIYDLFYDWHTVRDILLTKVTIPPMPIEEPVSSDTTMSAEEITLFKEVFEEAKALRPGRNPLHVMIVEDDPVTRRIIANGFKEHYALITANDASEAIANYLLYAPDIVFLDIGLPDASGLDVLKQIIACDPQAYVVMCSSNSYIDNVNKALNNGAAGFIAKPFNKEKLKHYIIGSAEHHNKSFT